MKTDELMSIVSSYIESAFDYKIKQDADEMAAFLVPYIIASQEHEIRADQRERCVQAANNVHNPVQCVSTPAFLRIRNDIIEAIKAE